MPEVPARRTRAQSPADLERRVATAAEASLAARGAVDLVDLLVRLHWLSPGWVDQWRQGRVGHLEDAVQVAPAKLAAVIECLGSWALEQGLVPREVVRVARTTDRRRLRFSSTGEDAAERAAATLWTSPSLSEAKRGRLVERESRPPDLVVVHAHQPFTCAGCGRLEGHGDLLVMEDAGPVCLACSGMDHLVFLGSGDAALTRRANRYSGLAAVVVRFSRARKRYERQGILVEKDALERAERELADAARDAGGSRGDRRPGGRRRT